jgi:peptidoglycan/xylan/chitin deacetylase (PgdA/CDA1 family)
VLAACSAPVHHVAALPSPVAVVVVPSQPPTPEPMPRDAQLIVLGFDGSGDPAATARWRQLLAPSASHVTFFLSGAYLLRRQDRDRYHPPHHRVGASDIGFAGDWQTRMFEQLQAAHDEGHEIASHTIGHFCSGYPGSVGTWNAADWHSELTQYQGLLDTVPLAVGTPLGLRSPCLEGDLRVLRKVEKQHGMTYDASGTGSLGSWPVRQQGVWELPLPLVPIPGSGRHALAMDYNFFFQLASGRSLDPRASVVVGQETRAALEGALATQLRSGRPPLVLGAHFEHWDHDAYTQAFADFLTAHCGVGPVRCVSFAEAVRWLEVRSGPWPAPRSSHTSPGRPTSPGSAAR